ncbi:META domain-containing protein [Lutimonas vermicola]|uniref:META domain-containing protein n=1 Tax=Lutimonas vermicola TaxID=414288 RepID=A0ABU9KZU1_9FLAO
MKHYFLFNLILSICFFSCGTSSNSSRDKFQDPHVVMHQEMHSELYQEQQQKLDGKWLIKQVYDMPIDSVQFDGKQPTMIIDLSKGIISGSDGCNSFHGKVTFKNDKIVFGPTAGTIMACNHMEMSDKILDSFNEKELTFEVKELLIFFDGDQQVMVLKRKE